MTEMSFLLLYPLALNTDRQALSCLFVESKELFILMFSYFSGPGIEEAVTTHPTTFLSAF